MMEFGFIFPKGFKFPVDSTKSALLVLKEPTWQQQVLAKGWGYVVLIPTSYQADNGAGLKSGIIGLMNKGHSRYGKATVVTMAYNPRFAIAFISSSGEGGVKLHRRNYGEIVENLTNSTEYYWMVGNFMKYG